MSLDNFNTYDPFADTGDNTEKGTGTGGNYVHIRIQQRNGRKTLTTVQGLPKNFDPKRILKVLKKEFATNGTIVEDGELGEVIQMQGDQRVKISEFITKELGISSKEVKIHGF